MLREKFKKLPIPVTIIISILLVFMFFVGLDGSSLLLARVPGFRDMYEYTAQAICEAITLVLFLLISFLLGYTFVFKNTGVGFFKSFYIGGFLLAYCFLDMIAQIYVINIQHLKLSVSIDKIVFYFIAVFLVGLVEELVFRGVILNFLIDRFPKTNAGILWAIIIDGVLFGAMHYGNMLSGVKFLSATVQVLSAAMLGIILATIYARTGNFWIVVIFHFWIDGASLLSTALFENSGIVDSINNYSALSFIGTVILAIPAFILIRKSKLNELTARANGFPAIENEATGKSLGTVSLIIGIVAICFSWIGYLIGLGVVGILGAIWSKKLKPHNNGMATGGLICSVVAIFLSTIMIVVFSAIYRNMDPSAMSNFNNLMGN